MNEVALAVILSSFEAYLVYGYTLYIYIIEINSSLVKNLIRQKRKIEMTLCHKKYLKREMTPCYNNIFKQMAGKFYLLSLHICNVLESVH